MQKMWGNLKKGISESPYLYGSEIPRDYRKLKEEKTPIVYLQPKATAAILVAFDSKTSKHRRNRMLLILMYDTGARVQELSDLNVSSLHLDMKNPFVTLVDKGRKAEMFRCRS